MNHPRIASPPTPKGGMFHPAEKNGIFDPAQNSGMFHKRGGVLMEFEFVPLPWREGSEPAPDLDAGGGGVQGVSIRFS